MTKRNHIDEDLYRLIKNSDLPMTPAAQAIIDTYERPPKFDRFSRWLLRKLMRGLWTI